MSSIKELFTNTALTVLILLGYSASDALAQEQPKKFDPDSFKKDSGWTMSHMHLYGNNNYTTYWRKNGGPGDPDSKSLLLSFQDDGDYILKPEEVYFASLTEPTPDGGLLHTYYRANPYPGEYFGGKSAVPPENDNVERPDPDQPPFEIHLPKNEAFKQTVGQIFKLKL